MWIAFFARNLAIYQVAIAFFGNYFELDKFSKDPREDQVLVVRLIV